LNIRFTNALKEPFARFLLRKLLVLLVTFFVAGTLLFIIPRLMPSSPVEIMISKVLGGGTATSLGTGTSGGEASSGTGTKSMADILREVYTKKFGLDQPTEIQFLLFWRRVFTFDFGLSYAFYPADVNKLVINALTWTLMLVTPIPIIGFLLGNKIGSMAALKGDRISKALYYIALYSSIMPYYWVAMIMIFIFGVKLHWFPLSGAYSERWLRPAWTNPEFILDVLHHYALPFLTLFSFSIGGWAVGMRGAISAQLRSTYVYYARQLGFSSEKIRKYVVRNAILPNFTWLPMSFAGLIGQTLLVEVVFGYPGLGSLMWTAVFSLDYPLLEATFLITILLVLFGNFICDILYGILDPTIGASYVAEAEGGR